MLKGKKIILGITGSIAAYKACYIIRGLIKQGAEVQVVITPAGIYYSHHSFGFDQQTGHQ
jgi:phosphopantothenoylcysteine decarboxylase/phosphopantothenate--cysteine ligase